MKLIHIFIVSSILLAAINTHAVRTACTITLNSADEKQVFQSKLSDEGFKFVELTDYASKNTSSSRSWMEQACQAGITCDILIISGHFGGSFFGNNEKNLSLSSSEMERLSCNKSCDGILKNPKEVFLFGCNTLATKEKDHRTPEQYRRVLLDDNIPANEVERIVQARYGALGASYKDQMRRIFPETAIIHGFDSVGPSGKNIRPFLEKFFRTSRNYSQRIQKLEGQKIVDLIEKTNETLRTINAPFANAMVGTAYTWCSGIGDDEKAAKIKKNICGLFQKTTSAAAVAIRDMLNSEDRTIYLMAINEFFKNNKGANADIYKSLFGKDAKLEKELANLAKSLEKSSAGVAFDVYETMYHLGFYSDAERQQRAKTHIVNLLNTATRESIDLAYSTLRGFRNIQSDITYNDLGSSIKSSPHLAEVLIAFQIKDSNATKAALSNLRNLNDENFVVNMLHAAALPGASEEKAKALDRLNRIDSKRISQNNRSTLTELKKGLGIYLEKDPKKIAKSLAELKDYSSAVYLVNTQSEELLKRGVYDHLFSDQRFIDRTKSSSDGSADRRVTSSLLNKDAMGAKGISKVIDATLKQKDHHNNVPFEFAAKMTVRNDELTNYFIDNLEVFDFRENSKIYYVADYMKNTKITESQKNSLKKKIESSQYKDGYNSVFSSVLD